MKDHNGWLGFWSSFAGHMDNNAVYISNSYRWARPLSDMFGKNIIAFTEYSESSGEKICDAAKRFIEEGRDVYYITDSNKPYSLNVDFMEVYAQSYKGKYIEDSLTFPPKIKEQDVCFKIYKIVSLTLPYGHIAPWGDACEARARGTSSAEYIIDIGEENIGLLVGFDKARQFSGMEGTARWTSAEAKLVIAWFGDNTEQELTIRACGMPKEAGVSEISIYINDKPIAKNYKIDEQIKEYIFHIPSGSIDTGNSSRVILTIKSNTWSPAKYGINGFPDKLGILLDWIKIN